MDLFYSFEYKNLTLSKQNMGKDDTAVVSINITNSGNSKGEEVVQLYIKASTDTATIKTLKGFKRISIDAGETEKVEFIISPEILSRWIDGKGFSVESDKYCIMIGSSSAEKDLQKVYLVVEQ